MDCKYGILNAFSAFITDDESLITEKLTDGDFGQFVYASAKQKITAMTGEAFIKYGMTDLNEANMKMLKNAVKAQVFSQTKKTHAFLSLYSDFISAGAKPVCVKGIVCRSLYPIPDARPSGDEDLIVTEQDHDICEKIMLERGFKPDKEEAGFENGYTDSKTGVRIELHSSPFESADEYFEIYNSLTGDMHTGKIQFNAEGCTLYAPAPDNHLLYLILHAFKHFIHSGVGIRQICDIALFASSFSPDWNGIFTKCRTVRADVFLNAVLLIGRDCFGLDIKNVKAVLPDFDEELVYSDLLDDILSGAIYGADTPERLHSSTVTKNSAIAAVKGKRSNILSSIFPSVKKLSGEYTYLKKRPYLLPAAWAQRLIKYIKRGSSSAETLDIAKRRTELLKKYNITD